MKPTIDKLKRELSPHKLPGSTINRIFSIASKSYNDGYSDGFDEGMEEELEAGDFLTPDVEEKIGVEYAIDAFKELNTMDEVKEKLKELHNRACNFMPVIG